MKKMSFTKRMTIAVIRFGIGLAILGLLIVAVSCTQCKLIAKTEPIEVENSSPPSQQDMTSYTTFNHIAPVTPVIESTPVTPIIESTPEPTLSPEPIKEYFDIPFDSSIQDFIVERMNLMEIDLEPEYIYALIFCESAFKQASESSSGASGYMQIMPATYKYMYPKMIEEYPELSELPNDIWDMYTNLSVGLYVLHNTGDVWGYETVNADNFHKVLTCYNRGNTGGRNFYEANGTWESGYSKKIFRIAEQIKADGGIEVY